MDTLQRASTLASLLVRHACAYGDLVADDVGAALTALGRRLWVGAVLAGAVLFAVAMGCLWIVALAWDTAARLWFIGGLFGVFALLAGWALLTLRRLASDSRRLMSRTGAEWEKDRQLLERLLPTVPDSVP
jgi:hypothetical protein